MCAGLGGDHGHTKTLQEWFSGPFKIKATYLGVELTHTIRRPTPEEEPIVPCVFNPKSLPVRKPSKAGRADAADGGAAF
jgi:hypothetical protein